MKNRLSAKHFLHVAVAVLLLLGFAGAASVSAQSTPAVQEDWRNADYGFSSRMMVTDANDDIYVINLDGSGLRRLTDNGLAWDTFPSFSPDGSKILFRRLLRQRENEVTLTNSEVMVMNNDGSHVVNLTRDGYFDGWPAWSPDGKYIAFLREAADTAAFYLIPALGGLERKLTDASPHRVGADAPYISWSPDGRQLAIVDRENPSAPLSIMVLDLETAAKRRITSPPRETLGDSSPCFSPDGNSIVFIR